MAFRKLFFKRVQGIRDNYLLQEGDIALDESDFKLYRGDGTTVGGVVISGAGGGSGIALTDISVTQASASGAGSLSYNSSTGVITYTPPTASGLGAKTSVSQADVTQHQAALSITESQISDLGTYLTSVAFADVTSKPTTIAGYGITDAVSTASPAFTGTVDFTGATSVDFTGATITGTSFLTSYTETDPVVGAITGIVKSDGAGNISAAVAGTDYLTTVAFADLTGKPTTIAGYGITDAFDGAFGSLSGTPTTLSGYGITDAATLAAPAFTGAVDFTGTTSVNFTGATVTGLNFYTDSDVDTHLNTSTASSSEVLSWNGSDYDWVAQSGGIASVADDTTPQLGGDLDLNSNNITGTGNINITGTITSTGGFTGTTDFDTITTDGLSIVDNNISSNRSNDDLILSASGTGNVVVRSNMRFNDNDKLLFGDDDDLEIFHNSSNGNTIIQENTGGNLVIKGSNLFLQSADSENYFRGAANGAVTLYYDNVQKFETTSDGISVTDHIALADDGELRLGTDNDMQISHSGVSGLIKSTTGTLVLQGSTVRIQDAGSSQTAISAADGVATLYHTNTAVLNTTAGGIQIEKGVQEKFATITSASGVTALDCSNGHVHYLTGASGDITANFTNLTLTAEYAVNLMVIINQGATPYEVTAVQIGGSAQTINWQGGSAPTGNANGIDAFSFTILNDGGSYVVLGQMVDFT